MDTTAARFDFRPITLDRRPLFRAAARGEPTPSADYSFAALYLWGSRFAMAFHGGRAIIREREGRYLYPIGTGPLDAALAAMAADAGGPFALAGVTEPQRAAVEAAAPGRFRAVETRDTFDYLYDAAALATLAGRKLHGKRGHVRAFDAAHVWSVSPLTEADFPACRRILDAWDGRHDGTDAADERRAVLRAFDAFSALELFGMLLVADGAPVAFTVGEMLTSDTLCVHFEKTLPGWEGAYPVINREFVRQTLAAAPGLAVVNREDDMGLENLRAAKLAYHPAALLKKYLLLPRD